MRSERLLLGEEAIALQGVNRADVAGFESFTNGLLWSLAGNAFTGTVAAGVFLFALS